MRKQDTHRTREREREREREKHDSFKAQAAVRASAAEENSRAVEQCLASEAKQQRREHGEGLRAIATLRDETRSREQAVSRPAHTSRQAQSDF